MTTLIIHRTTPICTIAVHVMFRVQLTMVSKRHTVLSIWDQFNQILQTFERKQNKRCERKWVKICDAEHFAHSQRILIVKENHLMQYFKRISEDYSMALMV